MTIAVDLGRKATKQTNKQNNHRRLKPVLISPLQPQDQKLTMSLRNAIVSFGFEAIDSTDLI